jgi:PAS domain-containing protein
MDAQHGVHSRHNKMDALPADAVFSAIESVEVALAGIDRTRSSDVIRRREAETILSRLADVPVAILIANGRARYVEVNAAAATLTGYTRSELLRMSVWNLTPEANQTQGISAWEGFLRDRRQRGGYQRLWPGFPISPRRPMGPVVPRAPGTPRLPCLPRGPLRGSDVSRFAIR